MAVPLDSPWVLRPEGEYRARTYNRGRQVLGLIDHLFVRYPVPLFLYRAILSAEGMALVFEPDVKSAAGEFREWFLTVARGESFAKATRGFFTKREAHEFLLAPAENGIEENIFWARAAAAGVPPAGCDFLVERFDENLRTSLGDRMADFFRFYSEAWSFMTPADRDEITDYVRAMVRDLNFSFKNRTYGSMRKRCQEWHQTVYRSRLAGAYRFWPAKLAFWEAKKDGLFVRADELTSSRMLSEEGQAMRHCVFTYQDQCLSGKCTIVSLRWYRQTEGLSLQERITLEVNLANRQVVQIRGKANRRATAEEMKVVRQFAGDQGLRIASGA